MVNDEFLNSEHLEKWAIFLRFFAKRNDNAPYQPSDSSFKRNIKPLRTIFL